MVDVGTGARWHEVYEKLDASGLVVAGARAGSVGVGGYLLGGGLSILDSKIGWACDQIDIIEVILSNGTLIELDRKKDWADHGHGHLFTALRGRGTNFAIATRFKLRLFQKPDNLRISFLDFRGEDVRHLAAATARATKLLKRDSWATFSISVGGQPDGGIQTTAVVVHQGSSNESQVLKELLDHGFHLNNQMPVSQLQLAKLYDEMNPAGYRQHRVTTTMSNSADAVDLLLEQYNNTLLKSLSLTDDEIRAGLLIQPLTEAHFSTVGDEMNMLGLYKDWSPLLMASIEARHTSEKKDAAIQRSLDDFIEAFESQSSALATWHPFRYLNYASPNIWPFQLQRTWKESWQMLMNVSRQYDPSRTFQEQMIHPFRITLAG